MINLSWLCAKPPNITKHYTPGGCSESLPAFQRNIDHLSFENDAIGGGEFLSIRPVVLQAAMTLLVLLRSAIFDVVTDAWHLLVVAGSVLQLLRLQIADWLYFMIVNQSLKVFPTITIWFCWQEFLWQSVGFWDVFSRNVNDVEVIFMLLQQCLWAWLKFVFSPDILLCGWLGSKHQLTN